VSFLWYDAFLAQPRDNALCVSFACRKLRVGHHLPKITAGLFRYNGRIADSIGLDELFYLQIVSSMRLQPL
jgi:hypothetical protein